MKHLFNEAGVTGTDRMREIADLDSRAGAPVGAALRAAADRIDVMSKALSDIAAMNPEEWGKQGIWLARKLAKEALDAAR